MTEILPPHAMNIITFILHFYKKRPSDRCAIMGMSLEEIDGHLGPKHKLHNSLKIADTLSA